MLSSSSSRKVTVSPELELERRLKRRKVQIQTGDIEPLIKDGSEATAQSLAKLDPTTCISDTKLSFENRFNSDPGDIRLALEDGASTLCRKTHSEGSCSSLNQNNFEKGDDPVDDSSKVKKRNYCTSPYQAALRSIGAWRRLHDVVERINLVKETGIVKFSESFPEAGDESEHIQSDRNWNDSFEDFNITNQQNFVGIMYPHSRLLKPATLLLSHIGFSASNCSTLQIIVDIWAHTLQTLGATLRVLEDRPELCTDPLSASLELFSAGNLDSSSSLGKAIRNSMFNAGKDPFSNAHGSGKSTPVHLPDVAPRIPFRSGETLLTIALRTSGFDPLGLHDHAVIDVVKASYRLAELARRLENKFKTLVTVRFCSVLSIVFVLSLMQHLDELHFIAV
jgi:hypothetical protein